MMHIQSSQPRPEISAPLISRAIALVISLGLTYAMWAYAEQQSAYREGIVSSSAACPAMAPTRAPQS
jgi:hypothetical protein